MANLVGLTSSSDSVYGLNADGKVASFRPSDKRLSAVDELAGARWVQANAGGVCGGMEDGTVRCVSESELN
jgi:hypothetical protein